jgi:catechol 2,3-dioxygenase-like lactoylglutathione lyase family enzyme
MRLLRMIPMLASTDVEAALAIYRDVLGFHVTGKFEEGGRLIWCMAEAGESRVMFQYHPRQAARNGGTVFYLYTDDIQALREKVMGAGQIVGEIGEEDGRKECELRDPDGNIVMFCEIVRAA